MFPSQHRLSYLFGHFFRELGCPVLHQLPDLAFVLIKAKLGSSFELGKPPACLHELINHSYNPKLGLCIQANDEQIVKSGKDKLTVVTIQPHHPLHHISEIYHTFSEAHYPQRLLVIHLFRFTIKNEDNFFVEYFTRVPPPHLISEKIRFLHSFGRRLNRLTFIGNSQ
jgi:hypothetical protein